MSDFLDSVTEYLAAAKALASDWAEKGALALEQLAAFIRAQSGGGVMAAPPLDPAVLAQCQADCAALMAKPPKAAAFGAGGGLFAQLLAFIKALLDSIKP